MTLSPAVETPSENPQPYGLSDEHIREILDALHAEDEAALKGFLEALGPADTAECLAKTGGDDREALLAAFGSDIDPRAFTEMDPELRRDILSTMSAAEVARILSVLDNDEALDVILPFDPVFQKDIIRRLSARDRLVLEEGLGFPEDSAGRLMSRDFVAVPQFWSAGKTLDYLNAAQDLPESFFDLFVITPSYHVTGEIPLSRLLRAQREETLDILTRESAHPIPATMDQEEVAEMFRRDNLTSAPVVDEDERLIGVITIDDVVDVIDEEAQEDILKLAGVEQGGDLYRTLWSTTGARFRWLFVNLLTAVFAAVVISFFETTIQEFVALAVLMPIVASMGGNAGTQTLTVAVRALATRELSGANAWRIIWKETAIGFLNGAAFAVIMGLLAFLWFENAGLGIVIGSAMIITLLAAGLSGAAIPLILNRMGSDPAVSSTVVLTTVTDVLGFFAFLGLAAVFL